MSENLSNALPRPLILSWDSRYVLYGNYICHNFQGGGGVGSALEQGVSDVFGGFICDKLMSGSWADRSPLHEAAFHGQLLTLKALITQGFNVNIVTMDRVSPLHEACLGGHVACVKLLLEHGAVVNQVSIDGITPLFNACRSGNTACLKRLLKQCPTPHPAHLVASPIHEAAKRGHWECVEVLLANGLNINLEVPRLGTPLYTACVFQRAYCVQRLLQLGADVHRGRGQDTPLHAAAQKSSVEVVELLMDFGADAWSKNAEGKRPIELASINRAVEQVLLQTEGPSSLLQLCRLCVRQILGPARLHLVSSLDLPHRLSMFLLYRK